MTAPYLLPPESPPPPPPPPLLSPPALQLYSAELGVCAEALACLNRRTTDRFGAALGGRGGGGGGPGGDRPDSQAGQLSARIATLHREMANAFRSGDKGPPLALQLAEGRGAALLQARGGSPDTTAGLHCPLVFKSLPSFGLDLPHQVQLL